MSVQDPRYALASRSQAAMPITLHEENVFCRLTAGKTLLGDLSQINSELNQAAQKTCHHSSLPSNLTWIHYAL